MDLNKKFIFKKIKEKLDLKLPKLKQDARICIDEHNFWDHEMTLKQIEDTVMDLIKEIKNDKEEMKKINKIAEEEIKEKISLKILKNKG